MMHHSPRRARLRSCTQQPGISSVRRVLLVSAVLLPAVCAGFNGVRTAGAARVSRPISAAPGLPSLMMRIEEDDELEKRMHTAQFLTDHWAHCRMSVGGGVVRMGESVGAAKSNIHGLGLVALEDIEPFTMVTFYAVHAVGQQQGREAVATFATDADAAYFQGLTEGAGYRQEWYHPKLRNHPESQGLFIDANPNKEHIQGWMGHLVNDGALCQGDSDEELLAYYTLSAERRNCFLVPLCKPLMSYVTMKAVPKGTELLSTYTHRYWLNTAAHSKSQDEEVLQLIRGTSDAWTATLNAVEKKYEREISAIADMFDRGQTQPSTGFGRSTQAKRSVAKKTAKNSKRKR